MSRSHAERWPMPPPTRTTSPTGTLEEISRILALIDLGIVLRPIKKVCSPIEDAISGSVSPLSESSERSFSNISLSDICGRPKPLEPPVMFCGKVSTIENRLLGGFKRGMVAVRP